MREADIAAQMGISRGPVREAFRQLDQEGLTYSHPYRGTVVLEFSAKETEEIFVPTRRLIETFVALNAYKVLTENDYDALKSIISKMKEASKTDNLDEITNLDIQFHTYLVGTCFKSFSLRTLEQYYFQNPLSYAVSGNKTCKTRYCC